RLPGRRRPVRLAHARLSRTHRHAGHPPPAFAVARQAGAAGNTSRTATTGACGAGSGVMRFDELVQRVQDTEHALELQHAQARTSWRGLRTSWREGWTPTRIMMGGLLSGFLVGRARP